MLAQIFGYLRDRSQTLKWCLYGFLAFTLVFDGVIERHHPHFFGDHIIGFWSVVGLFGCLGMVVICKGLSGVWLMKDEDYYERD